MHGVGTQNRKLSRLNGWPMRPLVNASPRPSRATAHDSGPMWIATPSSQGTCTLYSLPVSRRFAYLVRFTLHSDRRADIRNRQLRATTGLSAAQHNLLFDHLVGQRILPYFHLTTSWARAIPIPRRRHFHPEQPQRSDGEGGDQLPI